MRAIKPFTIGRTLIDLRIGDSIAALQAMPPESVDLVVADPPYFLSNGGTTCRSGKRVAVDKGAWDHALTPEEQRIFALRWISACIRLLRPAGTLFICGTSHGIHRVHRAAVDDLGCHLINEIVWVKPNPPPQLACRALQHASETILWLRPPGRDRKHYFNYQAARALTGKQMRSVWTDIKPPSPAERVRGGGHKTQKPIALIERQLLIGCPPGGVALDPFLGSGTALEAALGFGCSGFVGVELAGQFVRSSIKRAKWWESQQPVVEVAAREVSAA